jgi:two-component system, cell cycle response regulator DivK
MKPLVLVVEDNPDNRKLAAWLLEDAGYPFLCVNTAEEGLQALLERPVGIALMDVSLPGMDGKEATRRLRADPRWRDLPVIAVTAHATTAEVEAILASGVSAIVTKPIEEAALLRAMASLLGQEARA